jgi:hypothetical protein
VRKSALLELTTLYDVAYTEELIKPVLKRTSDKLEKCRELAYTLLMSMIDAYDDTTLIIPYLFPVLVKRLDAYDLEGTDSLPENMRPTPS